MGFWSFIGELAFFRWLFGELNGDEMGKHVNNRSDKYTSSHNYYRGNNYYSGRDSFDDFYEEQDDYDMMDDDF